MKSSAVLVLLACISLVAAGSWDTWSLCRKQHDQSLRACRTDAQCIAPDTCNLLSGTCDGARNARQEVDLAVACIASAIPSALWRRPLTDPLLQLSVNATYQVATEPSTHWTVPLPSGLTAACHWDPHTASENGTECLPAATHTGDDGFCGVRRGATGRCVQLGSSGTCESFIGGSPGCTGSGGRPSPGRPRYCLWPGVHSESACLNKVCGPAFRRLDTAGSKFCPTHCYNKLYTAEHTCHRHTEAWKTNPRLYGWDAVAKKCRVSCSGCSDNIGKATSSGLKTLGPCTLEQEITFHHGEFGRPALCTHDKTTGIALPALTGDDAWEDCPYLGFRKGGVCPATVDARPVMQGCVFPGDGPVRGAPFIRIYEDMEATTVVGDWLPDLTRGQCTQSSGGTWTQWYADPSQTSPILVEPTSPATRPEWCKHAVVHEAEISTERSAVRAAWLAATRVVTETIAIIEEDAGHADGSLYYSAWADVHGTWQLTNTSRLTVAWAALNFALRLNVTYNEDGACNGIVTVTKGIDRVPLSSQELHGANVRVCCDDSAATDSTKCHMLTHSETVLAPGMFPHDTGSRRAGHVVRPTAVPISGKESAPSKDHREHAGSDGGLQYVTSKGHYSAPEEAPKPTSAATRTSAPYNAEYGGGGCAMPGYLPPSCAYRICGNFHPIDQEIRGLALGEDGPCECKFPWDGPECNHCATPRVTVDAQDYVYVCAQLPLKQTGGKPLFARLPVAFRDLPAWINGDMGFSTDGRPFNRMAGTSGFDCMCRHFREEYRNFDSPDALHEHFSARAVIRNLPLNLTETNITRACLLTAGVDMETADDLIAIALGQTPLSIACPRSIRTIELFLLVLICILVLVMSAFCLASRCGRFISVLYGDTVAARDAATPSIYDRPIARRAGNM